MKSNQDFAMAKALFAITILMGTVILIFFVCFTSSSLFCDTSAYQSAALPVLREVGLSPSLSSDDLSADKSAKIRQYSAKLTDRCARQAANFWADYVDYERAEQEKIEAARKQFTLSK